MKFKNIKVALYYNESHPELYKKIDLKGEKLHFEPYFEVDKLSPIDCYNIMADKLNKANLTAYALNIKDNIEVLLEDYYKNKPDVIFNFIEIYKDKIELESKIVALFELLEISYTGSDPVGLANCQDKHLTKRILIYNGINTPSYYYIDKKSFKLKLNLNFPLIVKPAFEDASVGIDNASIVHNHKELKNRIEYVFDYIGQSALVEEYIGGREVNVSILGDNNPIVLPISEIDFSTLPPQLYSIVSYHAKWDPLDEAYHRTVPICPAKLPKNIDRKIKHIALKAFKSMGVRDYARVDIRLDKNNNPFVLEVNPNPDLTEDAGFMRSAKAAGFTYTKTLLKIIEFALLRKKN